MSNVGLFYVGAVLIVNGVMLLGWVSPRGAAPLNLFVGALQVFTPTYLILTADGDQTVIAGAAGLYLFGFTYLWVGVNALAGLPGHGLGWFSLFVAAAAVGYAVYSFRSEAPVFGIIWLTWASLWFLFFLLLGLDRVGLGAITGSVALVEGILTAAVPAWVLLHGSLNETWGVAVGGLAAGAILVLVVMGLRARFAPPPDVAAG